MVGAIVLFEDAFVERIAPINLARATFDVTCGAFRLRELCEGFGLPIHGLVRPHLRGLVAREGLGADEGLEGPILYLNASLAPSLDSLERLRSLIENGQPFLALKEQRITAALSNERLPAEVAQRRSEELVAHILGQRLPILDDEFPLIEHCFDVIRRHEEYLGPHLDAIVSRGHFVERSPRVFVGEGCRIAENVVFDVEEGPIVLGSGVRVRPFSYIAGPVRIGDHSLIIDHASIKHGAVLGHTVKAGGEVEASVIEPFSNKQHHGFLGHSYVGSWVNLGAGTSNSDLKNTYGDVGVDLGRGTVSSGMQFFGCVIGDFTKTAINTSIFTGKLIGVGSFVYGFVTTNVPSFTNYARSFGQVTEVSVDVMIKAQARASARRDVPMTEVDVQLLRDLYDLTHAERQLSSDQISL